MSQPTTIEVPADPFAQKLDYDDWEQGGKVPWIDHVFAQLDRMSESYKKYKVHLEPVKRGDWEIKRKEIPQRDFYRLYYVVNNGPASEFTYDRDCGWGDTTLLLGPSKVGEEIKQTIWMSDTRAEIMEHTPFINKLWLLDDMEPSVLINGLGIGMAVKAAQVHNASRIDVVEVDEHVIELVGPNFADDPRVTIHHADAYDITWPAGTTWDLAWHDIWPTITEDNLDGMDRLQQKYRRRIQWQASWQRPECLRMRRVRKELHAAVERGDWAKVRELDPMF